VGSIWRQARQWLPGIIVSLFALYLVFHLARWDEVGPALRAIDWRYLLPAIIVFLVSMLARVAAWWILLQRKASYSRTFLILNIGYLLNNLFPFRLGELGRAVLMGEESKTTPFFVLSTIMLERAIDLLMAACLLLLTLPLVLGVDWAGPLALGTLATVIIGFITLYLLSRTRARWRPHLDRWFGRWSLVTGTLLPWFDSLLDGFAVLTNPLQFVLAVLMLGLSWVLAVVQYYLLLRGVTPVAAFWWAAFVLGIAAFGVALPSAPASLGVYEASVVGAFALLGLPAASALAYAVTAHLIHFVITGVIGLYGLYIEGSTLNGIYQKVRGFRLNTTAET
jgi:uncharacterized protein (TIRG00374 family)